MFFLSVLLETKIFLRASCKKEAVRPHRERKRKRWRCDNSEGTARTFDGSATSGWEIANSKCLTWPWRRLPGWPRGVFLRAANTTDDSRHRSGSACVSECVHRTIYGLDESHF